MTATATYLRRDVARASTPYKLIVARAAEYLLNIGAFSKQQVLEDTDLTTVADAIRWDYVREFIEEIEGCSLVPVVLAFFEPDKSKTKRNYPVETHPEKYFASGYGKRTAGFASVKEDANARITLCCLKQRRNMANGVGKAYEAFVTAVKQHAAPRVTAELGKAIVKIGKR